MSEIFNNPKIIKKKIKKMLNNKRIKIIILLILVKTLILNIILTYSREWILNGSVRLEVKRNFSSTNIKQKLANHFPIPEYYSYYFFGSDQNVKQDNEDYDLKFTDLLIRDLSLLKERWTQEYVTNYKRYPPTGYDKWLEFAVSKSCPLHPLYYMQIDKDLMAFRDKNDPKLKTITYGMVYQAANSHGNIGELRLSNGFVFLFILKLNQRT
jgi:hypothetical protein